jgi:hypothetical protein
MTSLLGLLGLFAEPPATLVDELALERIAPL